MQTYSLQHLMQQRALHVVFQPILNLRQGIYYACEALLRGPEKSNLHSPAQLFAAAEEQNCTLELEWLAVETAILQFSEQRSALRLFLNMSIGCLRASRSRLVAIRQDLLRLGISPSRIVIELTENQSVTDFSDLQEILQDFRALGVQIAMDDMGEGFSNLRMWSEVRPEYVKIDRHFIDGIHTDGLKLHFVRAMHEIADACGSVLIAEGVESQDDLAVLHEIGIQYVQGFGIAHPSLKIVSVPSSLPNFSDETTLFLPTRAKGAHQTPSVEKLLHSIVPVAPETLNDHVYQIFEHHPALTVVPVVADGTPLGIITRSSLIDRFARPFRRELYGKKQCTMFMTPALVVDDHQSIQETALLVGSQQGTEIQDAFVVTHKGRYRGMGFSRELMGMITDLQIRAARYANPLTQLPGNVPINEQMDRLIDSNRSFVAAYCDLDHFKPYNDYYGYRRGDQIIQKVAEILTECAIEHKDFVGHIGGDDFIVLFQSQGWEERVQHVLTRFDAMVTQLVSQEHLLAGGYHGEDRRGSKVFHPLPALSIGCLCVSPGAFASHHDVSAALGDAKKEAKRIPGSSWFVERRQFGALGSASTRDGDSTQPRAVSPAPTLDHAVASHFVAAPVSIM